METSLNLAAVDLGASSGRVMLARFNKQRLVLEEVHRFHNGPLKAGSHLHWDAAGLFEEIKNGLRKAGKMAPLSSLGLDTWGVDFALLDQDDQLTGSPFHYRDPHTNGVMEKVFEVVSREEIFRRTGIQFLQLNSLYQLFAIKDTPALERAKTFLMMPDLFNFWLSGRKANEYSNATTTQFYNPHIASYDRALLRALGLPADIYPEIVSPGTVLGSLAPAIAKETGIGSLAVIAPACHDTGSAVAAAPIEGSRSVYISSGTWSLVGVETAQPVITDQSLAYNFTNEGGVYGTVRLLKNVAGLWLVQECRRIWASQGWPYTWEDITALAADSAPFQSLVDPDDLGFLSPLSMPDAIRGYCARTSQPIPESHGQMLRCIYESLALKYRWVISCLEQMLGQVLDTVHIIGGGSQNELLCQMTADAVGKRVIAGPVEATAIGNALVQAISLGHLDSLAAGRKLAVRSFPLKEYQPVYSTSWDTAYERVKGIING